MAPELIGFYVDKYIIYGEIEMILEKMLGVSKFIFKELFIWIYKNIIQLLDTKLLFTTSKYNMINFTSPYMNLKTKLRKKYNEYLDQNVKSMMSKFII